MTSQIGLLGTGNRQSILEVVLGLSAEIVALNAEICANSVPVPSAQWNNWDKLPWDAWAKWEKADWDKWENWNNWDKR